MTDTYLLSDLETEVEEEIRAQFEGEELPFSEDVDRETMDSIVDAVTPIWHWDLLAYAQDKLWLASSPPESATGDEDTAVQLISLNICEYLEQHARKIYDQLLEEQEDENDTGGPG